MNRSSIFKLFAFNLLAIFFLQSCSTNDATPSGSRAVKYEITGNFTGAIDVVATVANGSFEAIEVKKLPWTLEFTGDKNLTQLSVAANGSDGISGQKAVFKIYVGGKEVSSGAGTTLSNGYILLNPKAYVF